MTGFISTWQVVIVYLPGHLSNWENCCQLKPQDKIMAFFDWHGHGLWKVKYSVKRFDGFMI